LTSEKEPDPNADLKQQFLEAYKETGSVGDSSTRIGRSRQTTWDWRTKDADFARKFEELREHKIDDLEKAAYDRAVNGWMEPVYFQGKRVGEVRRFSTGLTIFMLKNLRPGTYLRELDPRDVGMLVQEINRAHEDIRGSVPRFGVEVKEIEDKGNGDPSGNGEE
jgi:hypothetical protein